MNLANRVTLIRIFVIPATIVLYVLGFHVDTKLYGGIPGGMNANLGFLIAACVVFSLAACTDFIDGNIARRTHTVTSLGKFLDPIADKVLIVVTLVLLVGYDILPDPYGSIAVGLILSREFIVSALRLIASTKGFVLAADVWGKLKTVFLDIAVGVLILAPIHWFFYYVGLGFFAVAFLLTLYSGFNYIYRNREVFSDKTPEAKGEGN
ncbi:MAG: CDP-diacylglycerol--glycerol-3-phosphate 3-phosphatidyltransferase [Christensenellales bacterium]|jgi:CDP-diacylglycerol--glycerol-3-phosphate 3-phosphatidyltransferase|nr:CDP-diacylglycerol--glycerol-3-phosphate 3-phosphatidyltransferase [Clostridia bacterium]HRU84504.1 CDP-diacylglycerol--glycerol-3-phosphate 3-phosphatidyltransferase [Eubacteriales bacterium]